VIDIYLQGNLVIGSSNLQSAVFPFMQMIYDSTAFGLILFKTASAFLNGHGGLRVLIVKSGIIYYAVKDWIGRSRGSLISSGVRKEHGLLFDSCHDVLVVVVAWSQSICRLQTIIYTYLLNLLSTHTLQASRPPQDEGPIPRKSQTDLERKEARHLRALDVQFT